MSLAQTDVRSEYSRLLELVERRRAGLEQSRALFRFLASCDSVVEWMADQTQVAASEDYGQDVEHVGVLIHQFDAFLQVLQTSEHRYV